MISKDASTEQNDKTPEVKEKERLLALILRNLSPMATDYRNTLKHTGGLLTSSMSVAYTRGIQDVLKLLAKDRK